MVKRISLAFAAALLIGVFFRIPAQAAVSDIEPEIKRFDQELVQRASVFPYALTFRGGASVAYGDVNGDGKDEIITGAGPGGGPHVRVLRSNGREVFSVFPYPLDFRRGVYVASCDLNGDGRDEVVTAPRQGGGPNVKVYSSRGRLTASFMVYDVSFRGGVTVACGDVTGDGIGEIITGSGMLSGNHVRVFDRRGRFIGYDFWPFSADDKGGVSVAVGDVDGDGTGEIITGIHYFGSAWVKVYRAKPGRPLIAEFLAFPEVYQGGVNLGAADTNNDGRDEIIVAANGNGGPHVKVFSGTGKYRKGFFPYPTDFRGGVFVAGGDGNGDGRDDILTGPGRLTARSIDDIGKRILVDLSEQRLYAYLDGTMINTFLVSTGVARYPTPTGKFEVYRKSPLMDYEWTYGPEHPDNYDIKDVPWNMNFTPHYYLHAAYWHNAFGTRRSHGCVNISIPNAKWLYDWTPLNTPVRIQE